MASPRASAPVRVGLAGLLLIVGTARASGPSLDALATWLDYNNGGWRALNRGDYDRAARYFHAAIQVMRPHAATHSGILARSYADYARVLYHQKRYAEAEPLARWALTVRETQRDTKPATLYQSLFLLAQIDRARGRPDQAESLLERALMVQEQSAGASHPSVVPTIEMLAGAYADQRKYDRAITLYRRALAIREETADESLKQAEAAELTASILRQIGLANQPTMFSTVSILGRAEVFAERAEAARATTPVSKQSAEAMEHFATVLRKTNRTAEADDMEARARAIRDDLETRAARARAAQIGNQMEGVR